MKPSNMAVVIALACFMSACEKKADVGILNDLDPKGTRWILEFDEKTKLKMKSPLQRR